MKCPGCGSAAKKERVINSRTITNGHVRRRRECVMCKHRWTTYEITEQELGLLTNGMKILDKMVTAVRSLV